MRLALVVLLALMASGCGAKNGANGNNGLPGPVGPAGAGVELIYPCGRSNCGKPEQVLHRYPDGTVTTILNDRFGNAFEAALGAGRYETYDFKRCVFFVSADGKVTW